MHISFILSGAKPFSPGVKPFLHMAMASIKSHVKTTVFSLDCPDHIVDYIESKLGSRAVVACHTKHELLAGCREHDPDILLSGDSHKNLELLKVISNRIGTKTGIYVLYLYGLHSLNPKLGYSPLHDRIKFSISSAVPFRWLTWRYARWLSGCDAIISCSRYTEMLNNLLYGVLSDVVIYPPTDTEVFRLKNDQTNREGLLCFVGSPLDTHLNEYIDILKLVTKLPETVYLFGNSKSIKSIQSELNKESVVCLPEMTDRELATKLQEVRRTFIPQKWEGFGYLGLESLLCGTPVSMLISQPWMELTGASPLIDVDGNTRSLSLKMKEDDLFQDEELGRMSSILNLNLNPHTAKDKLLEALRKKNILCSEQ